MIKVYKKPKSNFYMLELWEASTKHPDSVFDMEEFTFPFWADRTDPEVVDGQVFQWLLECASKLTFPFHAWALADYAMREWSPDTLRKKKNV